MIHVGLGPACGCGLTTEAHHCPTGEHFPGQQMGRAGSGTEWQEALKQIASTGFHSGVAKVGYQKRTFLVFHEECLKIPTQKLFLLQKFLGWHGNIFLPWISTLCSPFSSRGLVSLLPFMTLLSIAYPSQACNSIAFGIHRHAQSSCSLASTFCGGAGD